MEGFVIWIDPSVPHAHAAHEATHVHLLRIYSEVDEVNRSFRVRNETTVAQVVDEFYARTNTPRSELDRMKCETNGEDLLPHREMTIDRVRQSGECSELVWVFTNRPIHIKVNTRDKEVKAKSVSYADVIRIRYDGKPPEGPNWEFTIDYQRGARANPEGHLTEGHSVWIKDGMVFDVTATDKS